MASPDDKPMTFWDHLEALRGVIFRILAVALAGFIVAFSLKEPLFRLILAPSSPDFILYRWIAALAGMAGFDATALQDFNVDMFSTTLTAQFMIHMKMAFYVSLIVILPYTLYLLFGFVKPALHQNERKGSTKVIVWSYILFMTGIVIDYLIIFPLAFRFLGTYQVSEQILGIINAGLMKKYRRHAIVIIMIIAAVITPTTDVFTLTIVTLPIYLLYEVSIGIISSSTSQR